MDNKVATCNLCQSQFNIVSAEQDFLSKRGIPLPAACPSCRQQRRLELRGDRTLHKTTCSKCNKEIIVSFDPASAQNPVLCKADYEQYFVENDGIITDPLPGA